MNRKYFIKSSASLMALPFLESFAAPKKIKSNVPPKAKRLACIGLDLGFYTPAFYPKTPGKDYATPRLLKPIENFRSEFSVFSGLDHRGAAGHDKWDNWLIGKNLNSISMDQIVADEIGQTTKYPSMQFTVGGVPLSQKLSKTKRGMPLPLIQRPSVFYNKIFGNPKKIKQTETMLKEDRSAIDLLYTSRQSLKNVISKEDTYKLDEYFTSLREVERRLGNQLKHLHDKPAFDVKYKLPENEPLAPSMMIEHEKVMYDLLAIAFQLDITRVSSMFLVGLGQVFTIDGEPLKTAYHALSHHNNKKENIEQLVKIELEHMKCFNRFLEHLKTKVDVNGQPLLDSTVVLLGTGMGDANTHANRNLPTLIAGGGFKQHGNYIASKNKQDRMGHLFVNVMNQFGVDKPFTNIDTGLAYWS